MPIDNDPRIRPLGDRVLVELVTTMKSAGGIDLPEQQVQHGIIRAIGDGVNLTTHPIKVGNRVFLPRGSNVGDKIINRATNKATHILLPISHVAAVIDVED
jgi:co-chaperonin GroES (HSP10)